MALKFIGQALAQQIDAELMNPAVGGFSIDQLMELAGLSVAQAIYKQYDRKTFPRVLVVAGPGNNGGDGLVAARHLVHFGYRPTIHYPKPTNKDLYKNLQTQLHNLKVPFTDNLPDALAKTDLILDAIFGFSFSGEIRPPFDSVIKTLKQSKIPIASIDIPSGWDVEKGNASDLGLNAETLISLTAPKEGAKNFKGHHWLGGRFVPPETAEKLGLNLPEFPDTDQCVKIA
ncbi:hypothetical protein HK097_003151 [Rhizophlyctis rosea]|uniref:NAD(P)H-hydrate epimerase n=1 Tax=Rhizophlyctis rosea TaxID=64517 RepID=A0AAD5S2N1_9FUNG|nr:hypothetical protein HK097_003151 [Rhizophlyctis rosea]